MPNPPQTARVKLTPDCRGPPRTMGVPQRVQRRRAWLTTVFLLVSRSMC